MSAAISIGDLVDAAMKGIAAAHTDFQKWSGGSWLWEAPEYLATVYVARELARLKGTKFISLERNARRALRDAGAIARGPIHKHVRASGRFDLLLFWASGTPRAPIEVKGWVNQYKAIAADMRRLEEVIHRAEDTSSLQFGLMVFHTSARDDRTFSAAEKLTKWISNIESEAHEVIPSRTAIRLQSRRLTVEGDSAWTAVSILLKPTRGSP